MAYPGPRPSGSPPISGPSRRSRGRIARTRAGPSPTRTARRASGSPAGWPRRGSCLTVDAAGNQIGRRPGAGPGPPLMIGSHLDTVEAGGRFDGIAGVLAGLEVARCLHAAGHRLAAPARGRQLHLRGAVGLRALDDRQPRDERQARRRHRGAPPRPGRADASPRRSTRWAAAGPTLDAARRAPGDVARYLELHIEQSVSLDRAGVPVGVVTAIAAPSRYRVAIRGRQDHAGGTPMADRRDAAGRGRGARAARRAPGAARPAAAWWGPSASSRRGPNMINIVPGEADLLVDFRGIDPDAIAETLARFEAGAGGDRRAARRRHRLDLPHAGRAAHGRRRRWSTAAEAAAGAVGTPWRRLTSGASHDANHVARLCPIGLLFIPCRDGRSHCPEEWAEVAHLATGTRVLLELLLRLDRGARLSGRPTRANGRARGGCAEGGAPHDRGRSSGALTLAPGARYASDRHEPHGRTGPGHPRGAIVIQ